MANGSVYLHIQERFPSGAVFAAGQMLIGNADVIRATDLGMKHVRGFTFNPYSRTPVGSVANARLIVSQGSLGSITSYGSSNYISVRNHALDSYSAAGTMGIGTLAGSVRGNFIAFGW